jgi:hypothetical protein
MPTVLLFTRWHRLRRCLFNLLLRPSPGGISAPERFPFFALRLGDISSIQIPPSRIQRDIISDTDGTYSHTSLS